MSFIIPAKNEERYIGACLSFLFEEIQVSATDIETEIIVVDNGSTDRTADIARSFPDVLVVSEERPGTGYARQKGFETASGELVAFLDADTRMSAGWIRKARTAFEKNSRLVSLSGPYQYYDAHFIENILLAVLWWISAPLTYLLTGYMILGGNVIITRKALEEIRGFDTSISFYGDDTNLAKRLSKVGNVVFRMNFRIGSSCRRFRKQGYFRTAAMYALHFVKQVFLGRDDTFTKEELPFYRTPGFVVSFFLLVLLLSLFWHGALKSGSLPLVFFYLVLVWNTYFSVEFFSYLVSPRDRVQMLVDSILGGIYLVLPFLFGEPVLFLTMTVFLFLVATFKYLLLRVTPKHRYIRERKIRIDFLGALACLFTLLTVASGGTEEVLWIWCGAFLLANFYFLLFRPMYPLQAVLPAKVISQKYRSKTMNVAVVRAEHRASWGETAYLRSVIFGLIFLTASLVFNHYASIYATEQASNSVKDLLLDILPVINVDFIVNEGTGIFGAFVLFLLILKPQRIPFAIKASALFITIRSFFITFTHLGPFPYHSFVDPNDIFRMMTFGGDYFFSGHTGFPFLLALIFWEDPFARMVCLVTSIFFGASVLFGHLHYSIDVFAAFFITHSIFVLAQWLFKRDWEYLRNGTKVIFS